MTIVFETQGWLDIDAITTFGVNAKPKTDSPIGYFGTGLKYALAVLLREGCKITVWRGYDRWDFDTETKEFRGEKFDYCYVTTPGLLPLCRKREQLPFTLELGKNWELWQAFRELFSNTLDEGGECRREVDGWEPRREYSRTVIAVEGADFERVFDNRWETFLMDGEKGDHGVQILPRESMYLYYRGVRVLKFKERTINTYNILSQLELTEDRTAKSQYMVDMHIRNALMACEDRTIVERALNAVGGWYESRIDFTDTSNWVVPSALFSMAASVCDNNSARRWLRRRKLWEESQRREAHFTELMVQAIEVEDWDEFLSLAQENPEELCKVLENYRPAGNDPEAESITVEARDNDIPF